MPRILPGELQVGEALPWDLYDESNQLLLAVGTVIGSVRQIDSLLLRGARRADNDHECSPPPAPALPSTPFQRLDALINDVAQLFDLVEQAAPTAASHCLAVVEKLDQLFAEEPDALLGAVHLVHEFPYTVVHPVHAAILCSLMAETLGYDPVRRRSLQRAALLQNIGMREVQQELVSHAGRLDVRLQRLIHAHPGRSAALMRAAGIDDPLAERIVLQHHERSDGTGYPAGLRGPALSEEAAVLNLADRYGAMISARGYRHGFSAGESLRTLYRDMEPADAGALVQQFIQAIGIYPPGAFVRLSNGEGGIVITRGKRRTEPVVRAYISPRGGPYQTLFTRDCAAPGLRVTGTDQPDPGVPLNLSRIWGFID